MPGWLDGWVAAWRVHGWRAGGWTARILVAGKVAGVAAHFNSRYDVVEYFSGSGVVAAVASHTIPRMIRGIQ